ncbi:ATP-binding protein [Moraxella osloensis]|uniref:ATP-binding protein n=1 Tax=Faucicola osloensis TaxID=34062 RepID=UPI0020069945|nr:ATP-binding protein [Moraxella osloensis]MCK6158337.1 ATP-binding protein [Moraxella osloensis]
MKKSGLFAKQDFISNYLVKFYLGGDSLVETYRVEDKIGELKILKLIKPDALEKLDVDALSNHLKKCQMLKHANQINVSVLKSFENQGKTIYYYVYDFIVGESLSELLTRKIYLGVRQSCVLGQKILKVISDLEFKNIFITPETIILNYQNEDTEVLILPILINQFIKPDIQGVSNLYLAYLDNHQDIDNYLYSIATLLYRCIVGVFPWRYDLNWENKKSDVVSQILQERAQNNLVQADFETHMPKQLANILLNVIMHHDLTNLPQSLDNFIHQYFNKFKIDNIAESATLDKPLIEDTSIKGLSKVAGMSKLKQTLQADVIKPLQEKNLYKEYGIQPLNGILLYGPPGCGKTFIAKQLAEELNYSFFEIKPSDLASTYVHGTQEKIGKLFRDARLASPSIIFIDEVDAILPSRDTANINQHYASEVNEFLAQMTDCSEKGIFMIMATNRPDIIDKAILRTGRTDKLVYVDLPDFLSRQELLKLLLNNRPIENNLDISNLALNLSGYTCSDIKFIVNEAAKLALTRNSSISTADFSEILQNTAPSVSFEQIEKYESFKNI